MKKKFLLALCILLISACNSSGPGPTPTLIAVVDPSPLPPTFTAVPSPTQIPPTDTPVPTPLPTNTPLPQSYGPDNFPTNVDPLTGLPVSDPTLLNRRPVGVKIQLFPRGQRPPWGPSLADLVYEYYQNNGLTRLHAVFYGNNADQAGPIRSARLFDANVIRMYKEILAFGGADKRILNRLFAAEFSDRLILEGNNRCPPMCRIDPNGNNYLVTNTAELTKFATAQKISNDRQNLNGMVFDLQAPAGGKPGTQIFTHFSISAYTRWDYDPASGRYLRFYDTQESNNAPEAYEPAVDRLNNQQISAANLVILFTPHQYLYRSNSGNSEIVEIPLNKSGPAYVFRDGQIYQATWNRPKLDSTLYLTFPNGKNFPLKQGNTWFQVIGSSSKMEQKEPGVWRFTFSIP